MTDTVLAEIIAEMREGFSAYPDDDRIAWADRLSALPTGASAEPAPVVSASTERVWRAIYERVCFAGEPVADVLADYDIAARWMPLAATVGEGTGTPWTVLSALDRFNATCEDDESTDLPRPILDALVAFGYLCKPKRGCWEMTPAGEAALTPQTVITTKTGEG